MRLRPYARIVILIAFAILPMTMWDLTIGGRELGGIILSLLLVAVGIVWNIEKRHSRQIAQQSKPDQTA
jgi:hypothetical protein